MAQRGNPEADAQRAIVAYLRAILPIGSIVHHSANEVAGGGPKARLQQSIRQGMGVHAGFSDLIVISQGRVAFLEVKSKVGRARPSQLAFGQAVEAQGFPWAIIRTPEDAAAFLEGRGFKTRRKIRP